MAYQTHISRKSYFNCAHSYEVPGWTPEKNKEEFGKCFDNYGHGNNYILEAHFKGPISEETGMIVNLRDVDIWLKAVLKTLDKKFLNKEVDYFKTKLPTTENIAKYCFDHILKKIDVDNVQLVKVRVYEYEDLWAEYGDLY